MTPIIKTIAEVLTKGEKGYENMLSPKPDGKLGLRYDNIKIEPEKRSTTVTFYFKDKAVHVIKTPYLGAGDTLDIEFLQGEHFLEITEPA